MSFLLKCTAQDLLPKENQKSNQPLIQINETTTIEETLRILAKNNVLSVPIYSESEKRYLGILDLYEIMSFIAFASWDPEKDLTLEDLTKNTDLSSPAVDLLGTEGTLSDEFNSLWVVEGSAPIKLPMEYLAKGVYRILIEKEDSTPKIITQSDLTRFINENIEKFGDFVNETLESAGFIKNVHSIPTKHTALRAFQEMRLKELHEVAIINEKGILVGSLSGSDVRGFTHDKIGNLLMPVLEFIQSQNPASQKLITVQRTKTIRETINLIVEQKIRRVWIVDDEKKPVGYFSLTDVALYFFNSTLDLWYTS